MKHLLPLTALLLAAAGLTACGGGGNSAGETSAPASSASASASNTAGYTMAQVQEHGDETSCWTVIEGKVYDVTPWISEHPGGPDRITALCGTDGTAQFTGMHEGDPKPASRLEGFLIGSLQN